MAEVPPIQVDIKPPVQTTAAALTQTTAVSGGGAAGVITLKWVFMGCPLPPPDTVLTVMAAALRARPRLARLGVGTRPTVLLTVFGSLEEALATEGAIFDLATPPSAHGAVLERLPEGAGVLIQRAFAVAPDAMYCRIFMGTLTDYAGDAAAALTHYRRAVALRLSVAVRLVRLRHDRGNPGAEPARGAAGAAGGGPLVHARQGRAPRQGAAVLPRARPRCRAPWPRAFLLRHANAMRGAFPPPPRRWENAVARC